MTKAHKQVRMVWEDDIPYPVDVTTSQWQDINWRKIERRVHKLQKRIYRASARGDVKAFRKLQKTLMKSWSAKTLAVRRVTQDNQGKKTAGVDGVKSLSPVARMNLVGKLKLGKKSKPVRRVWIPKPGKNEKRPLGIPTMYDRALQALVKLALEPEWEARFEPNSYGFRPGRSCHDAIEAIFNAIRYKSKYLLDADIAQCFDKINHSALLRKLNTFPAIRRQIRAWLKAGVIDWSAQTEQKGYSATSKGTPQGGVISPLLANIALHGMENRIKQYAETLPARKGWGKRDKRKSLSLIRYADDFVILHENITVVQRCKEIINEWLADMGLELKPSKTRLAHTLISYEGESPGFNFLGFNIRHFPVGKYHSGKNTDGTILGFKTIIKPSKESQKEHYKRIADTISNHKSAPQSVLIERLRPIIIGWCNYYSTVASKETFSLMAHLMYLKLFSWAKRRHSNKSRTWIKHKYWKSVGYDNWVFAIQETGRELFKLPKHDRTEIKRHTKVKDNASPYDGNPVYWSIRLGNHPEMPLKTAKLLKKQKGKCTYCGTIFKYGDSFEVDHIIPKSKGGNNYYENLQILHRHCHDSKTTADGVVGGIHDKNRQNEEPCEGKTFTHGSEDESERRLSGLV